MMSYDPDDMDALHILPLSIIPLKTAALGRARLIKNSRLLGMIELFSGKESGSGQLEPELLPDIFKFSKDAESDVDLIKALSLLPSYDVYSLRVELRRQSIPVEDHKALKLSDQKAKEIAPHMKSFTRPLLDAVYGDAGDREFSSFQDIVAVFKSPDAQHARQNLKSIARDLEIDLSDIPRFLETYGDVYLSLAFYRHCLDQCIPTFNSVKKTIAQITRDPPLAANRQLRRCCALIETKLGGISSEIAEILEMFRIQTEHMWEQPSAKRFKAMESLIREYQTKIGGVLCVLTVKMNAWSRKFPTKDSHSLHRRADFLMSDLWPGIETVENIRYADGP